MIKKDIAAAFASHTPITVADRYSRPEIAHILDGTSLWTSRVNHSGVRYTKSEKSAAKETWAFTTGYMVLVVDNPSWGRLTDAEYAAAVAFVADCKLTVHDVIADGEITRMQFPHGVVVRIMNPRYLHAR